MRVNWTKTKAKSDSDYAIYPSSIDVGTVVNSYLSNCTWAKGPTMFTIPAIDYLVTFGVCREDAEGNEGEILDQLNGEIEEQIWSELTQNP